MLTDEHPEAETTCQFRAGSVRRLKGEAVDAVRAILDIGRWRSRRAEYDPHPC